MEFIIASNQQSTVKQPLILAVDDDDDNLSLLIEVVSPLNCSIITATSGQTTIDLVQKQKPALILLDIMLPDLNGLEVVYQLKHNPQTKDIPVIAVTALARPEDRERMLLGGCDDYISKPYMLDELEELICCHLDLKHSLASVS